MSLAVDALQPAIVSILFSLGGRVAHRNLIDIVTPQRGAGFDLGIDNVARTITIDFREPNYIGRAMAGDALRFASAAFTSMKDIGGSIGDRTSTPWGLIRLYYSAFYAGHGILRLLGQSCSYVDAQHGSTLQRLAAGQGITPTFALRGLYHCSMNPNQTGLTLASMGAAFGGAHEIFWAIFDNFLEKAVNDALKSKLTPSDAQAVFIKLDLLRGVLRSNGGGPSWLSAVRNDIQYRHGQGVWEPPIIKRTQRDQLVRLAEQWQRDPMEIDVALIARPLNRFAIGCAFIVALCRALLTRIMERTSATGISFARAPLAMC
jgi:hypothetical protein